MSVKSWTLQSESEINPCSSTEIDGGEEQATWTRVARLRDWSCRIEARYCLRAVWDETSGVIPMALLTIRRMVSVRVRWGDKSETYVIADVLIPRFANSLLVKLKNKFSLKSTKGDSLLVIDITKSTTPLVPAACFPTTNGPMIWTSATNPMFWT